MDLKEQIRNRIIENEKNELNGLREMHRTHTESADLDEDSSLELDDFAQQDQSRESARSLESRINSAKQALDSFVNISFSPKSQVEPGALVLTDSLNFYIGISASQFEHEDRKFIGIQTDAPIYAALEGKKSGDELDFNEKKYKILKVL